MHGAQHRCSDDRLTIISTVAMAHNSFCWSGPQNERKLDKLAEQQWRQQRQDSIRSTWVPKLAISFSARLCLCAPLFGFVGLPYTILGHLDDEASTVLDDHLLLL